MTTDELLALQAQLVAAMASGVFRVSTPQLGEVEYQRARDLQAALAWVTAELEAANPQGRTFVFQSNRGTGI